MTHNEQILKYMKKGHGLTSLEALKKFGCIRLSARIYDLEALGYTFARVKESHVGLDGRKKNYVRYTLLRGKNG